MLLLRGIQIRCDCCNKSLNDYESTLKSLGSGEYLNTCTKCLDGLGIETEARADLNPFDEASEYDDLVDDEEEYFDDTE